MPTLTERLTTAVVTTETEATKLFNIVEGPATGEGSVVETVGGPVKTAAAKILEIEERADDIYVARQAAQDAQAAAEAAQTASESARDASQGFRDEAEGFKNDAQAAASTAAADAVAAAVPAAIAAVQDELNDEVAAAETARAGAEDARDAAEVFSELYLSQIEREGLRFHLAPVELSNGVAIGTSDFTVVALIRPTSFCGQYARIFSEYGGECPMMLLRYSNSNYKIGFYDGTLYEVVLTGILDDSLALLVVRRTGSTIEYSLNGSAFAALGNSAFNFSDNRLFIGNYIGGGGAGNASEALDGNLSRVSYWNYAISYAELIALIARGLVTLPEQRGGNMTPRINDTFTSNTTPWEDYAGGVNFAWNAGGWVDVTYSNPGQEIYRLGVVGFRSGARYRISLTISAASFGAGGELRVLSGSNVLITNINGDGTWTNEFVWVGPDTAILALQNFTGSASKTFQLDNFIISDLGTLFEMDSGQRNAGYMLRDTSGGARHPQIPVFGAEIIDPGETGFISYTRGNDGYIIGDRAVIPAGYVLTEIWATGDGTATIGESAGTPANVVASVTLTSTPQRLTLLVAVTSNQKLYIDLGTATTVSLTGYIKKL